MEKRYFSVSRREDAISTVVEKKKKPTKLPTPCRREKTQVSTLTAQGQGHSLLTPMTSDDGVVNNFCFNLNRV